MYLQIHESLEDISTEYILMHTAEIVVTDVISEQHDKKCTISLTLLFDKSGDSS